MTLMYHGANEKVREIYRLRQETEASIISERNLYALEARKKGREEGRQEGERLAKIESAKQMLKDGMPVNLVAKYSGLSVEEVRELS